MKKAGILGRTRYVSPCSFRHTLTTLLADSGYAAEKIQASFGWTSDSARRGYTHLKADEEQVKIIDGVFEAKKAPSHSIAEEAHRASDPARMGL
jgi:integrase